MNIINKYYDLTRLRKFADSRGIIYRLIIGQRSNGKTFSVLQEGLDRHFATGKKIAYIRRYKEDITKPNLETLFDPQEAFIRKMSSGTWSGFDYRSRKFYFTGDEGKAHINFCDTFSLSAWERQKGSDKGEYCLIAFDEFITRDSYLANECDIFLDVLSSILRDRDGVPVYMIANTVSQHCPYFAAFGFQIKDIKQGDLRQVTPHCAIEYCNPTGRQNNAAYFSAFKNPHSKMIVSGDWDFREYPSLYPHSHLDFNFQLRFFVILSDRKICGEILTGKHGAFIYFYPFTGAIKYPDSTIIYGGDVDGNMLHARSFGSTLTSAHILIDKLVREEKCFYSDNATGDAISAFINNTGDI